MRIFFFEAVTKVHALVKVLMYCCTRYCCRMVLILLRFQRAWASHEHLSCLLWPIFVVFFCLWEVVRTVYYCRTHLRPRLAAIQSNNPDEYESTWYI